MAKTIDQKMFILEIAKEILVANIAAGAHYPSGVGLETIAEKVEIVYDRIGNKK